MSRTMIVVAGGAGTRMGADMPKQFIELKGLPILMHTLQNLHGMDHKLSLILVLPEEHMQQWKVLCAKHRFEVPLMVTIGGTSRFLSVQNGLKLAADEGLIGVHDGVRPFVSKQVVDACFETAEKHGAAVPGVPIVQSVREETALGSKAIDRSMLRAVQTPQCFRADLILNAYAQAAHDRFTDDATVVEAAGHRIEMVQGNDENIKITSPADLALANLLIS